MTLLVSMFDHLGKLLALVGINPVNGAVRQRIGAASVSLLSQRLSFSSAAARIAGTRLRYSAEAMERSPLAKAAASLPVVVGHTTRGFKSLPSPPISKIVRWGV
jgi:hypothetical protein